MPHAFFRILRARAGASAPSPSTWRANSRTRYEPGVHTGMKTTSGASAAHPEMRISTWTRCVAGAGIEIRYEMPSAMHAQNTLAFT
jgi:hypothetical protein